MISREGGAAAATGMGRAERVKVLRSISKEKGTQREKASNDGSVHAPFASTQRSKLHFFSPFAFTESKELVVALSLWQRERNWARGRGCGEANGESASERASEKHSERALVKRYNSLRTCRHTLCSFF